MGDSGVAILVAILGTFLTSSSRTGTYVELRAHHALNRLTQEVRDEAIRRDAWDARDAQTIQANPNRKPAPSIFVIMT